MGFLSIFSHRWKGETGLNFTDYSLNVLVTHTIIIEFGSVIQYIVS